VGVGESWLETTRLETKTLNLTERAKTVIVFQGMLRSPQESPQQARVFKSRSETTPIVFTTR
jgi:hypothetical protein